MTICFILTLELWNCHITFEFDSQVYQHKIANLLPTEQNNFNH
jgi:hypothetical protein